MYGHQLGEFMFSGIGSERVNSFHCIVVVLATEKLSLSVKCALYNNYHIVLLEDQHDGMLNAVGWLFWIYLFC